jgi:hypothetical protein
MFDLPANRCQAAVVETPVPAARAIEVPADKRAKRRPSSQNANVVDVVDPSEPERPAEAVETRPPEKPADRVLNPFGDDLE